MDASPLKFDRRLAGKALWLIGVDEAGRGALAGPVVAGAVALRVRFLSGASAARLAAEVRDSKCLKVEVRERLFEAIVEVARKGSLLQATGTASVEEIAEFNILGATKRAMARAVEGLGLPLPLPTIPPGPLFETAAKSEVCLAVDGLPLANFPYAHTSVVQGDGMSFVIGMASILAKVTRDRLMRQLAPAYPEYGFDAHKGYGTERHRTALFQLGATPLHRELFLRKVMVATAGDTL